MPCRGRLWRRTGEEKKGDEQRKRERNKQRGGRGKVGRSERGRSCLFEKRDGKKKLILEAEGRSTCLGRGLGREWAVFVS